MQMLKLDIKSAHRLVNKERSKGNDVRWDGWDIVFFRPSDQGRTSPFGAYRNNQWGFDNRVVVNSAGIWEVDDRNVRRVQRSRSRR